jgi:signal transduction histidine kinase
MARVRAGDLTVQVAPSSTREFNAIFNGFNEMVTQLRHGRAAEDEARRLELERVEQLASVGELAAGLAHEIRNPLSGVKAVVEVVARDTPDESRRAVLRDASRELVRIDQTVRELLQYARPKKPVPSAFDLNALVSDAVAFTLPPATHDGRVGCELGAALPRVVGDAGQVRQVLVNLLLNAGQAAGPTGHVTIVTGAGEDRAWCRVRDDGPGVSADRAEAIFRPFVTSRARGTGLGLPISRRMIELQGGRLTLDNPGEAGASFTFTLPAAAS